MEPPWFRRCEVQMLEGEVQMVERQLAAYVTFGRKVKLIGTRDSSSQSAWCEPTLAGGTAADAPGAARCVILPKPQDVIVAVALQFLLEIFL